MYLLLIDDHTESKHVAVFSVLMSYNCVNTKTVNFLVNYYKSVIIKMHGKNNIKRDRRRMYIVTWGGPRNHCCCGKTVGIAYSEFVFVSLGTHHAKRMRRIIYSTAACPAQPYFPTLSHNRRDFRENVIEHRIFVLIFSTIFVWNTSHSKNNSATDCHKFSMSSCKVPVIRVRL
jgi:hypothetical protein